MLLIIVIPVPRMKGALIKNLYVLVLNLHLGDYEQNKKASSRKAKKNPATCSSYTPAGVEALTDDATHPKRVERVCGFDGGAIYGGKGQFTECTYVLRHKKQRANRQTKEYRLNLMCELQ